MSEGMSDIQKLTRTLVQNDPNPARMLRHLLATAAISFSFEDMDKSSACLYEFLEAAAKYNAADNVLHIVDHPKEAQHCVTKGARRLGNEFVQLTEKYTREVCKELGLPDPYEADTNTRTREEILKDLDNG